MRPAKRGGDKKQTEDAKNRRESYRHTPHVGQTRRQRHTQEAVRNACLPNAEKAKSARWFVVCHQVSQVQQALVLKGQRGAQAVAVRGKAVHVNLAGKSQGHSSAQLLSVRKPKEQLLVERRLQDMTPPQWRVQSRP